MVVIVDGRGSFESARLVFEYVSGNKTRVLLFPRFILKIKIMESKISVLKVKSPRVDNSGLVLAACCVYQQTERIFSQPIL